MFKLTFMCSYDSLDPDSDSNGNTTAAAGTVSDADMEEDSAGLLGDLLGLAVSNSGAGRCVTFATHFVHISFSKVI